MLKESKGFSLTYASEKLAQATTVEEVNAILEGACDRCYHAAHCNERFCVLRPAVEAARLRIEVKAIEDDKARRNAALIAAGLEPDKGYCIHGTREYRKTLEGELHKALSHAAHEERPRSEVLAIDAADVAVELKQYGEACRILAKAGLRGLANDLASKVRTFNKKEVR